MSVARTYVSRLSTRCPPTLSRSTTAVASLAARRTFASSQPPRSQSPPAHPKENSDKQMYAYVAIGLGIGGAFAFLLGRPGKAAAVAHETSSVPGRQSLKGGDEKK
ncbi:uncharacterized protein B0I36DRAFT_358347 [Microdochium trichocladiopsis]|uniref:Uncharacterized protein n=1 Tax=Microdochium trichocladiopsis TaxID=1682393 RepID=A0A9P8YIJ9_9PEZI|nr:uncharacterized protein B0I36DRAFT_358347 [Microdochium trichocladiopsis]KAH7041151.1 hypothetical protein B0I36DRAFT_358347 [Microdochium trichocladiopsis]